MIQVLTVLIVVAGALLIVGVLMKAVSTVLGIFFSSPYTKDEEEDTKDEEDDTEGEEEDNEPATVGVRYQKEVTRIYQPVEVIIEHIDDSTETYTCDELQEEEHKLALVQYTGLEKYTKNSMFGAAPTTSIRFVRELDRTIPFHTVKSYQTSELPEEEMTVLREATKDLPPTEAMQFVQEHEHEAEIIKEVDWE